MGQGQRQGQKNVPVIDSREIAKMVEMRHDNLCRNIQHYIDVIGKNSKLSSSNFFIPTTYKQAGNGKEVTRYDVTPDNEYAKPYMKWTPIGRMSLHSVLKHNGYESVNEQYYMARSMRGTV